MLGSSLMRVGCNNHMEIESMDEYTALRGPLVWVTIDHEVLARSILVPVLVLARAYNLVSHRTRVELG